MSIEKIKTNICIVGAGPAGSTTSLMLCKMGIPHTIVDASEFPRDKICGDALDFKTIRVLNHLDSSIVSKELCSMKESFSILSGIRVVLPGRKDIDLVPAEWQTDGLKRPVFIVAKRLDFDNLLFNKIDRKIATICEGTVIKKIERKNKLWTLSGNKGEHQVEIEANMLVGADGDHSVVLKHVGERKIDRKHYSAAIRQYWKGIEGIDLLEVYFPKHYPFSYLWIFPLPNGEANVGFGMRSNYIQKKNINIKNAFNEILQIDPLLAERFKNAKPLENIKGWGLPLSGCSRKAFGDGWLLVGDAASMISPATGEGIGEGMLTGYIAAHFLQRAVKQNSFDEKMFMSYNREIHKRLKREEKLHRFLNIIPGKFYTIGIRLIISNTYLQKKITKSLQKWVETAYNKPIDINLN